MTVQPITRQPAPVGRGTPISGPALPLQPGLPARGASSAPAQPGAIPGTDPAQASFRLFFAAMFGEALAALADRYWTSYVSGMPYESIVEEIRKSPEHEAVFAGFKVARGKDQSFNEAKWVSLTREYVANLREFGLPPGFYDEPGDFKRLIEGEVAPGEQRRRLLVWQSYERETRDPIAEQEARRVFQGTLGRDPTDGDFLAMAMDPDRAVTALERAQEAGRIATEARRANFGQLEVGEALGLSDLGVTQEQARAGFGMLNEGRELLSSLPGEAGDTFTRSEQLGLVAGTDPIAQQRLRRQQRRRTAVFEGSGGISSGGGGLTGLAPA